MKALPGASLSAAFLRCFIGACTIATGLLGQDSAPLWDELPGRSCLSRGDGFHQCRTGARERVGPSASFLAGMDCSVGEKS